MLSENLAVFDRFPGVLLDAYGVFWGGNGTGLLPGAKAAMEQLVRQGKTVGILSNATRLATQEIQKFETHGLIAGVHFHFVITSGAVAKKIFLASALPFETPRYTYRLFQPAHPKFQQYQAIFEGSVYTETKDILEADFIYVSVPHIDGEDQTDPRLFHESVRALLPYGLPMVCANPDRFAHEGAPAQLVVRQGSIAAYYEDLGGNVFYIGKPGVAGYIEAMRLFADYGLNSAQDIVMVGDTPETDIRGANAFGMASVLITETGIMHERIRIQGQSLDAALSVLPASDVPDYCVARLSA